eukprot:scaffold59180_cov45-Phaeocystis_antarctica.AAC.4
MVLHYPCTVHAASLTTQVSLTHAPHPNPNPNSNPHPHPHPHPHPSPSPNPNQLHRRLSNVTWSDFAAWPSLLPTACAADG